MCEFFSFCTEPEGHGGKRFYFDWQYRKENLDDENDSHSLICKHFKLNEDICNKYEFNPLTKAFKVDQVNSPIDDRIQAEDWVNKLDFKRVVEPLIVKPIVNPFELPEVKDVTPEIVNLLKQWASVWDSARDSVWNSVGDSVGDSVRNSVWKSVRNSVWYSVWYSVGDYISSFFDIKYKHDFSPCVTLWNMGIVPKIDGKTWRLHTGKDAHVIYEISQEKLQETNG